MVYIDISEVLRCQYIDAAADLNPGLFSLVDKEILYGSKDIPFIFPHPLIIRDQSENGKMVALYSCDYFFLRQILQRFFCPEFQQFVPCFPAEAVINILEVSDVVIGQEIRLVRMRQQQFFHTPSEPIHVQQTGQRILIHHLPDLLLMQLSDRADPLCCHNNDQRNQK